MKQEQWVSEFCGKYGCAESTAHAAFYSANSLNYRRFLARWAEGLPADRDSAHYWWVKAREREPRAKRFARLKREVGRKAKRTAYYSKRKAEAVLREAEALRQAEEVAKAMRARSLANGVDPDREGVLPVIHKGKHKAPSVRRLIRV